MKPFENIDRDLVLAEDELFVAVLDKFPVSPGHTLIIVRRIAAGFKDLTPAEKVRLMEWIDWAVSYLEDELDPRPDGFNLGLNDGRAAGQTIGQLHFHIIPRYNGDVPDPRGGVRLIFPRKAKYWD